MPDRYKIEWAPTAERDLHEIVEYIAVRDTADAAVAVYQKIMGKVEDLCVHPTRGRIPPELSTLGVGEYRELVISPYGVFYRITGRTVGILAMLDRRRDLEEIVIQRALRM
jgi:toxin ParE1/3/4